MNRQHAHRRPPYLVSVEDLEVDLRVALVLGILFAVALWGSLFGAVQ